MSIIPQKRAPETQALVFAVSGLEETRKLKGPACSDAGGLKAQSCSCDPMDRSPPDSSVPGIF